MNNLKCKLNFGDESDNPWENVSIISHDNFNDYLNGTDEKGAVCNSIYLKQDRYKSWLRIWSCLVWVKNRKFAYFGLIFFGIFGTLVPVFIAPLLIIIGCYTQVLCKVTQTIKDLKKSNENFSKIILYQRNFRTSFNANFYYHKDKNDRAQQHAIIVKRRAARFCLK